MEFHYSTFRIHLRHPFTLSRGSNEFYDIVLVYLTMDGVTGIGEAAPSTRYDESFDGAVRIAANVSLRDMDEKGSVDDLLDRILPKFNRSRALKAAFDMAIHDLWSKVTGTSLAHRFLDGPGEAPQTSFTIGIDRPDIIRKKVAEAEPYPILKVKLGTEDDRAIINAVREVTDKPIRVDANEGWDLQEALKTCEWLSTRNVEFVEQPLPADRLEDTAKLKERCSLKIMADENCVDSGDIPRISHAFDGINIKLMKCGGLREAFRMIKMARERNLDVMLGCMIETSLAVTAAAHLSPLVDFADLDGNILIDNDPFVGVLVENGQLVLPPGPGLGVELR